MKRSIIVKSVPVLLFVLFQLGVSGGAAQAAVVKLEAVMSPKERIRLDFADGSKHFVS